MPPDSCCKPNDCFVLFFLKAQGNTAAHQCFRFHFDDLGRYLIEKGADVGLINNEGYTVYDMFTHSNESGELSD